MLCFVHYQRLVTLSEKTTMVISLLYPTPPSQCHLVHHLLLLPVSNLPEQKKFIFVWRIQIHPHINKICCPFSPTVPLTITQNLGDHRNIIRTLIPLSISTPFIHSHNFDLLKEFTGRNKVLNSLIPQIVFSLRDCPLPSIPDPAPFEVK